MYRHLDFLALLVHKPDRALTSPPRPPRSSLDNVQSANLASAGANRIGISRPEPQTHRTDRITGKLTGESGTGLPRPRQAALMTRPGPSQCVAARSAIRREASQPPWRCCPARGEMRFQLLDWAGRPILQYVKHDGAGRPTACAWTSAPCAFRRSDPSPSAVDKRHRDDVYTPPVLRIQTADISGIFGPRTTPCAVSKPQDNIHNMHCRHARSLSVQRLYYAMEAFGSASAPSSASLLLRD